MDKKFFKDLVLAPSPSGFEQPAQEVYRNYVKDLADEVKTDVHGNVIALKKGERSIKLFPNKFFIFLFILYYSFF